MKISHPQIVTTTNSLKNKFISMTIGDPKIVVDLLRKHYQNPRRTMLQEYLSNARDAHREINQTKKIRVKLPTTNSQMLSIRDFGPGMTEDRLVNYFCSYASSTKRETNEQTGGFGLGTKIAWAYRPNFFVKNYFNGVLYTYEASIAENYEGGLKEVSTSSTIEENGVEIIIPIYPEDIKAVVEDYCRITQFWREVEVINLQADELPAEEWEIVYEDENFAVIKDSGQSNRMNQVQNYCGVLLDNLFYPIPQDLINHLFSVLSPNVKSRGQVVLLKFNSGELKPTIAREQLEESSENNLKIKEKNLKIVSLFAELENSLIQKVKDSKDIKELSLQVAEYRKYFRGEPDLLEIEIGSVSLRNGYLKVFQDKYFSFVRFNAGSSKFSKKRKTNDVDLNLGCDFFFKDANLSGIAEKEIIIEAAAPLYLLAESLTPEQFEKVNKFFHFKSSLELVVSSQGVVVSNPHQEYDCEFLSVSDINHPTWGMKKYRPAKVVNHCFVKEEVKKLPAHLIASLARQQRISLLVFAPEDMLPEKERVGVEFFLTPEKVSSALGQLIKGKMYQLKKVIEVYKNYELFDINPFLSKIAEHRVFQIAEFINISGMDSKIKSNPTSEFLELMNKYNPEKTKLLSEVCELAQEYEEWIQGSELHQNFQKIVFTYSHYGHGSCPGPGLLDLFKSMTAIKEANKPV